MKIPAMANKANIFFLASGPALRQRSTQISTTFWASPFSAILSQATSPSSLTSCGNEEVDFSDAIDGPASRIAVGDRGVPVEDIFRFER